MKKLKTFEQYITEGKYGRFEIYIVKDGIEQVIDYATTPDTAESIKDDYEQTGEFDNVWVVDTHKKEEFA